LYESVMGDNPSAFKGTEHPVEKVSWFDAVNFANKLSAQEGLEQCYQIDGDSVQWENKVCKGWRLPTEAEWEYAARGGQDFLYSGSNNSNEVAWSDWNAGDETHPVGRKKANGFGLYDMSGNVWEWCWDWYGDYSTENRSNPTGAPTGSYRVARGGSWYSDPGFLRVSNRDGVDPTNRGKSQGFRLGRSP